MQAKDTLALERFPVTVKTRCKNIDRIYPLKQAQVSEIFDRARQFDIVKRIIVFGSSVTSRCNIDSDLDLCVEADISDGLKVYEMQKAYKNDPIGFGTALREACRNIMIVKMKTKAFLEPSEDAPYLTDLIIKPEDWEWTEPQIISTIKYVVSNVVNTVILVVRIIM